VAEARIGDGGTLRGCLIGAGSFARNHALAWRDLAPEGARLVGVCDLDLGRARDVAAALGAEAYDNAATMLDRLRPDFVDVATTPPSHRALVELGAPRARLVICQKPLAEAVEDAEAMVAACAAHGAALLVHENFRWQRPFRRMRELMPELGAVRFGRFSFRHGFDVYAGQPYLARQPRLAILDVGVHVFDLLRLFLGEVTALSCETQRRNPRPAGEDAFTALTRHAGGAVGVTDVSFDSRLSPEPFPETLAVVEGDEGTLELRQGYRLVVHGRGRRREEELEPEPPAWGAKPWHAVQDSVVAIQRHALAVLRRRSAPEPSGADNLATLRLCRAAYEAAATGRRVAP
jgi:predicted dehydrogenase